MMNILFIFPDALRADSLHCYGYPKETSPFIDKLASEGVLFKNVISTSSHTFPGLISAFTGLGPITHRIDGPENYKKWKNLWKGWKTPFDIMGKNGYLVAGTSSDFYYGFSYRGVKNSGEEINDFIEEYKDRNFFVWYYPFYTHLPYNPKPPYDTMFLPEDYEITEPTRIKLDVIKRALVYNPNLVSREYQKVKVKEGEWIWMGLVLLESDRPAIKALYDGAVKELDNAVESHIKKLDDLDLLDDTIVIITSDHGEEILERGSLGHTSCSLAGTLYDENIKVPLIIRYPKAIPKGKVVETQVSLVDIMPTLFEIIGLDMSKETEGHSLMPLIRGEKTDFKEEAYAVTTTAGWQAVEGDEREMWCIRTPQWKLIYYNYSHCETGDGQYELYNLKDDPGEKNNIIEKRPGIAKELKNKLHKWIATPSFFLKK